MATKTSHPLNVAHVIAGVAVGFSLILSFAIIWYLAVVQLPATERLQGEISTEDTVVSILIRISTPAKESMTTR